MDRNTSRSRLDFERNRSRRFIKDQIAQRLGGSTMNSPASVSSVGIVSDSALEGDFDSALNKMIAASGGKISISSGKRSTERQAQLWADALKKYGDPEIADNWVARPGTSNHERGTAADLKYADDATRQWAHQNAGQYGLNFPMGNEPWHIEPNKKGGSSAGSGSVPPVGNQPSVGQPQFKIESGWDQKNEADDSSDYGLKEYIESKYTPKQPTPTGGGFGVTASLGQDGRKTTGNAALDEIIYGGGGHPGESGFNPNADNPTSTAFGIGQLIQSNRQHYGQLLGIDPNTTNEAEQLALMNAYVKDRYGSPEAAVAFRRQHGWY